MVVPGEAIYDVRRHSILPTVSAEHAVVVADKPAINAVEPQVSAASLQHCAELIGMEAWGLSVEESQMDAVEACQPVKGGDPEISVRRLRDAANLVLGHAIVDCPDFEAI